MRLETQVIVVSYILRKLTSGYPDEPAGSTVTPFTMVIFKVMFSFFWELLRNPSKNTGTQLGTCPAEVFETFKRWNPKIICLLIIRKDESGSDGKRNIDMEL